MGSGLSLPDLARDESPALNPASIPRGKWRSQPPVSRAYRSSLAAMLCPPAPGSKRQLRVQFGREAATIQCSTDFRSSATIVLRSSDSAVPALPPFPPPWPPSPRYSPRLSLSPRIPGSILPELLLPVPSSTPLTSPPTAVYHLESPQRQKARDGLLIPFTSQG